MRRSGRVRRLQCRLNDAIRAGKFADAVKFYRGLEVEEPNEPRWPHRRGDLLLRMQQREPDIYEEVKLKQNVADAYERAVELYIQQGFIARATAIAKVVLKLDPLRDHVLGKLQPDEARRLHRSQRETIVTADETFVEEPATGRMSIVQDAAELTLDPSAPSDQVLFLDPEEDVPTSEIDVSQMELRSRPSHASIASPVFDVGQLEAKQLARLPSTPLFAEVPQEVFVRIVRDSTLVDLESEERLIHAGDTADALFVIVEGTVEVQPEEGDTPLSLGEGDVVGISCLLANVTYQADVIARSRARMLRISKTLLDHLVEQYPAVGDVLLEILSRRLVSTFIRTNPLFKTFDELMRLEVARMFEIRRAPSGTILLDSRKRSDGLYIPLLGELFAFDRDGTHLGRLKLGKAVGQWSLLTRGTAALTVQCRTDTLVLRMPATRFHQLANKQPAIVVHLREISRASIDRDVDLVTAARHR